MNNVHLPISELSETLNAMLEDGMETVLMSLRSENFDNDGFSPAFIYLEAFSSDGNAQDYGSIDSLLIKLPRIINKLSYNSNSKSNIRIC